MSHGLARPNRRRVFNRAKGFTLTYTVDMADGSGWWPVTETTYKKLV